MTTRAIFHCGLTKTGTTSLQVGLRTAAAGLAELGVTSVVDSRDSASRELYLPDDFEFFESLHSASECISINSFYYQYRRRRANAGIGSSRQLLRGLTEAVRKRAESAETIVISGEGLEALLAYRDELFAEMLHELSDFVDVELVAFTRPIQEHALSSWQEFSWGTGMALDMWLAKYRDRVPPAAFWSDLSQPHFANLVRFDEWIPFWQDADLDVSVVPLSSIPNSDSAAYFFEQYLDAPELSPGRDNVNAGWPPNLLRVLPSLSNGFNGDYERFRVTRIILGEYPLEPEEGRSVQHAALELIGSALAPQLYESTRRSEELLGLKEGTLGIAALSGETELEAMRNVREWQQPTPTDWVNLSYALLGHTLFEAGLGPAPAVEAVGEVALLPIPGTSIPLEPTVKPDTAVRLDDGLRIRSPLFNLPITKFDNRWELLTDIVQKWFDTQDQPFDESNRCRILEIGVWKGWNVTPFFKRFGPVFDFIGLDPYGELVDDPYKGQFWESDAEAEAVYQDALAKFDAQGATLLRTTSDDYFSEDVGLFDIIFVDGDHRFPQASRDLNAGLDHLRPGGLLMCDDVGNNFHPEVEWAVREFYNTRKDDIAAYGAHPLFFQLERMPFPVMLQIATFLKR